MTHSFFAYNSTLHIPLILAGPGIPSLRTSQDAGHVDLFPTLCRSAGNPPPRPDSRAGLSNRFGKEKPCLHDRSISKPWMPISTAAAPRSADTSRTDGNSWNRRSRNSTI